MKTCTQTYHLVKLTSEHRGNCSSFCPYACLYYVYLLRQGIDYISLDMLTTDSGGAAMACAATAPPAVNTESAEYAMAAAAPPVTIRGSGYSESSFARAQHQQPTFVDLPPMHEVPNEQEAELPESSAYYNIRKSASVKTTDSAMYDEQADLF